MDNIDIVKESCSTAGADPDKQFERLGPRISPQLSVIIEDNEDNIGNC